MDLFFQSALFAEFFQLANHPRVLACTQRSPPSGPREGFAPRFLRAVFMARLRSATSQAAAGSERHSLTLQRGIPLQQRPHSLATAAVIAGQVVRSQVARTNLPRPQT